MALRLLGEEDGKWRVEDGEWIGERGRGNKEIREQGKKEKRDKAEREGEGHFSTFSPSTSSGQALFNFFPSLLRWGPVFLWMSGIFYFSSRRNPLSFLPSTGRRESIDKVAHFAEYAGFLFLLHRALSHSEWRRATEGKFAHNPKPAYASQHSGVSDSSEPAVVNNPSTTIGDLQWPAVADRSSMVSLAIALVYAISDELHQEFTPGRRFELADIGYDVAGMIAALGFIWIMENGKGKMDGGKGDKGTSQEGGWGRAVRTDDLSRDERFMLALHDVVLSAFQERFGDEPIVGVNLTPFAHECWITVRVTEKTPSMVDLAQELEAGLREDAGKHVNILVQQPWKATVTDLLRKTLTLGR